MHPVVLCLRGFAFSLLLGILLHLKGCVLPMHSLLLGRRASMYSAGATRAKNEMVLQCCKEQSIKSMYSVIYEQQLRQ